MKQKNGPQLIKQAKELGVSLDAVYSSNGVLNEPVLQQRVRDVLNLSIAHRNWILALVSSIASVISAAAAWWAIYKVKP